MTAVLLLLQLATVVALLTTRRRLRVVKHALEREQLIVESIRRRVNALPPTEETHAP